MYEAHWNLLRKPFDAKVDAGTYYPSESHQAAALKIHYAIEQRRAVALLCGESGAGKSMLLDSCLSQLSDHFAPIARIVYPAMPADQLLKHIARQIGPQASDSTHDLCCSIELIERILRHNVSQDCHAVLAIDEAHLLQQFGTLETLRLILNLANDNCAYESPITLILCGSPSLISHLSKHSSLEDRVAVRCLIERFSFEDTVAYIQHRMRAGGCSRDDVFDMRAMEAIQMLAQGIPRRINRLCDLSLMIGFAQELRYVSSATIESAHLELSSHRRVA